MTGEQQLRHVLCAQPLAAYHDDRRIGHGPRFAFIRSALDREVAGDDDQPRDAIVGIQSASSASGAK
jgi:hypothetical protein